MLKRPCFGSREVLRFKQDCSGDGSRAVTLCRSIAPWFVLFVEQWKTPELWVESQ